jgi:spermidine synthase
MPASRHYAAIFVLSLTVLALEITVARVLSVALLSHYAFVAVSLAMFGIGLGALAVYLAPHVFRAERLDRQLVATLWTLGVTAALAMLAFLHLHVIQELSWRGFATLGLAYTVLAVPFFCGGLGISLLMTHGAARIGPLYAADLLGASAGSLVVVAALQLLPAPLVAVAVAVVAVATALLYAGRIGAGRLAPALAAVLVAALAWLAATGDAFTMRYVKSWATPYSSYEVWNAFSRISVFDYANDAGQPLGLSSERSGPFPPSLMIDIDGTAWTPMMHYDGNPASIQFLRDSVLYLAHHITHDADVLVIGTGGGRDLLAARAFNQRSIRGLELNPLMRHVVDERYGDYSGRPYTQIGATVIEDEARSRLAKVDQRFDVIQLSLIDTFSLNAAGGVVFSENYLYTVEAFREYFRHLTPDGVLTVSRYFAPKYPLEMLRLLAMARVAWAEEGVTDFASHVVVLSQAINATMLVKRSPFTAGERDAIAALAAQKGFTVRYLPGGHPDAHPDLREIVTTSDLPTFLAFYPFIVAPPTDDRPFFFHFLRGPLAEIPSEQADPFQILRQWNDAQFLMYLLIGVVTTLAAVFFLGPLLLLARGAVRGAPLGRVAPLLLYFACLGYGFMMLEIPLMQRFILFLGYPVYALAVILFALLLFSGLGSLASGRFGSERLPAVLVVIIAAGALYVWGVPRLVEALMGLGIAAKIALTVLLLAPLGLVLGMAYPLGIGRLTAISDGLVAWAWGLNAALSVVASVLATYIGSRVGFSAAMASGVLAYAVGLGCILLAARPGRRAAVRRAA